jgi:hypothetical protein
LFKDRSKTLVIIDANEALPEVIVAKIYCTTCASVVKCTVKRRRTTMIDKPKEDQNQKSESNRFIYQPGELQPYDPNDKSELTETEEDETEEDPLQMTDEELEDKLKEF